jgi:hypothetical protein
LPLPVAPAVIASQVALLAAVHVHPELAETATWLPVLPAAFAARLTGLIDEVQLPA